jgi:malate dehydrogenase
VASLVKAERLDAIEQRVRHADAEVIDLLKTGSAHYSPASSALLMAEAYLHDRETVLPAAAYVEGDYGLRDLYVGVQVKIGAGWVEKAFEIALTPSNDESAQEPRHPEVRLHFRAKAAKNMARRFAREEIRPAVR